MGGKTVHSKTPGKETTNSKEDQTTENETRGKEAKAVETATNKGVTRPITQDVMERN